MSAETRPPRPPKGAARGGARGAPAGSRRSASGSGKRPRRGPDGIPRTAAPTRPVRAAPSDTRTRLIEAAGRVFAARGYRGATMRAIARRAGTNLAAAHYHFGSKEGLYREVARVHFERLRRRLLATGGNVDEALAQHPSRDELIALVRARLRVLCETVLPPDSVHAALMKREMVDPSAALPFIVRRWIAPLQRDTGQILGRLAPGLSPETVERCTRSAIGQVLFYATHRPALLLMRGRRSDPPDLVDQIVDHVVDFSIGGLVHLEARERRRRACAPAPEEPD